MKVETAPICQESIRKEAAMKVHECMSRDVHLVDRDCTIRDTAILMAQGDTGIVPVHSGEQLVGILTDRDIAVGGVAQSKTPECSVTELMTREVRFCYDSKEITGVARRTADIQVRRFPVVDRKKVLVGIISLADIARSCDYEVLGGSIIGISHPGGLRAQLEYSAMLESTLSQQRLS